MSSTPSAVVPTTPTPVPRPRHYLAQSTFRKFTLDEYHRMIEQGVLMDGEPYELLEGNLVHKMSRGSPHDSALQALFKRLLRLAPPGWDVRGQSAVTLPSGSEPEPDLAFVRGDESSYRKRHPAPSEIGLLVEVSDSSLAIDREDKGSIYAGSGIPVYWVVNVVDKVIEVYTLPAGSGEAAAYTHRESYLAGTTVPVVLDGNTIGTIAVSDVFG
jgi:Uma2 family endonuclease